MEKLIEFLYSSGMMKCSAIYIPVPVFDLWLTIFVDYFTFQTHMIFHLKN